MNENDGRLLACTTSDESRFPLYVAKQILVPVDWVVHFQKAGSCCLSD
jgi:hypothetical protein